MLVSSEVHVGTPKTHRSRSVPYPEFLALPLAQLAEGKARDQLLFGNGSEHVKLPASRNGWFTVAVRAAQEDDPTFPRVTPHDLRHTAASLAVQAGGACEGGAADARPCVRCDDSRCVRGSVRRRSRRGRGSSRSGEALRKCCHGVVTRKGSQGLNGPRSLVPTGAPDWNRTSDLWYRKPTLYPLSYGGVPNEVITGARRLRPRAHRRRSPRGRSPETIICTIFGFCVGPLASSFVSVFSS